MPARRTQQDVMTETEPTDQDLWAAVAAGEEAAFGTLFDRHSRAVYNHAFRLCGSWSVAEDLTQATFLVAWRKREQITIVHGTALPWLLVVAGNHARTEWRSARRRRALLGRMPVEHEPDPADDARDRDRADHAAGLHGRADEHGRSRRMARVAHDRRQPARDEVGVQNVHEIRGPDQRSGGPAAGAE
jgi:DNA-directed RNA polymerase specialized sigma24 family protein